MGLKEQINSSLFLDLTILPKNDRFKENYKEKEDWEIERIYSGSSSLGITKGYVFIKTVCKNRTSRTLLEEWPTFI